jgi:Carboxypeptidase regulatory-like domain/TonB dependent receptor
MLLHRITYPTREASTYRTKLLNIRLAFSVAVVWVLASSGAIHAQSTFGTVLGTVKDPSGNLVSLAKVELRNKGTDAARSTLTNEAGSYQFSNVDVGTYVLIVEAPGFQKSEFTAFDLGARETKRLDADLKVSSQTTTVNVESSGGAVIQTDTSSISETKTGRELVDLPVAIATRGTGSTSPISTLTAQPGVQTDATGGISVSGALPTQLSITIDGLSVVGARTDGPLTELFPSFNAIEEIRVGQTINPAEFGGVSDITTISKSGTNSYHGGAFENLQNSYMNAGNPFSHTTPPLKMNDFGFFLGGPVSIPKLYSGHDKTFFFGSYEGLQLPRSVLQVESVPGLAQRSGDLSAYSGSLTGYPGNVIPASRISPLSIKALQYLFPEPNYGAPGAISNNYLASFAEPIKSNQGDLRVDQSLTSKQQVYVRMTYKNRRVEATPTGSAMLGPFSQPEIDYALTAAYNYVISPAVINELRGGFSGNHYATTYGVTASSIASELGLTNLPGAIPAGNAVPNFNITGLQPTGGLGSSLGANKTIQFLDTLTWTKGQHTMKFGADYRYLTGLYTNVFSSRRLGQYTFNGSVMDSLLGSSAATPLASFLLGYPDTTNIATVIQPDTRSYASHYAFFTQDDWKVTPRLTLNIGLRYEYHPMFLDHLSNTTNFLLNPYTVVNGTTVHGVVVIPNQFAYTILNPGFAESIAPTPILTAAQAGIPESLRYSQKTDFAPRFGFAWRPFSSDKTVIRGGYGKFIEALLGSAISSAWGVSTSDVGTFKNTIVNGTPTYTFPNAYPSDIAQPGTQAFYQAFNNYYKDPYVQEWDITVEQDLGKGVGMRVSYDGNHGSNLGLLYNANEVPANTVGFSTANLSSPYPLWSYMAYQDSKGISNYNALTVAVQKRFSAGLQFQASYIFAKNLADNAGYNPTAFTGEAGGTISNQFDPMLDYGNVAFTHRNRFLMTYLYELPFGKGKPFLNGGNGLLDRIVGGWELAGVLLFQTGPYMTILAGGDPSGTGFNQLVGNGRADTVTAVDRYANQSIGALGHWVNPAAFAVPANNIGRFADSAVGAVAGPGTQAISMSLMKSIRFTESLRLQFGAEVSNLFNHPNYAVPSNLTVGTSGFSSVTGLQTAEGAGPRAIQVTGRFNF